jgi:hypothetical protein
LRLGVKFRLVAPKLPAKADQKNWQKRLTPLAASAKLMLHTVNNNTEQHYK